MFVQETETQSNEEEVLMKRMATGETVERKHLRKKLTGVTASNVRTDDACARPFRWISAIVGAFIDYFFLPYLLSVSALVSTKVSDDFGIISVRRVSTVRKAILKLLVVRRYVRLLRKSGMTSES